MTNEELIAKIKAEIERLCDEAPTCDDTIAYLMKVECFLDTLESETTYDTQQYTPRPSVSIEDVARVQFASHAKVFDKKRKAVFDWEQFKEVAGIFYGFGKKDHSDTLESEKPIPKDLEEAAREFAKDAYPDKHNLVWMFKRGAKWQKEQDEKEQADLFTIVALDAAQRAKEQMMENYPKWRRIKAGERLPCPAYVWTIAYDNYPDCFEGRLMPNIQGVKVGRDTWYLPVDVIHNLPKED